LLFETMRFAFVVAAIAVAALATSVDLQFEGGANLTNAGADFSFRYSSTTIVDIPSIVQVVLPIPDYLEWHSLSIDASAASTEAKAKADAMFGLGLLPSSVSPPIGILAYGSGEGALNVDVASFAKNLISLNPSLDANFAGGVVAMTALGMRECDPENKTVGAVIPFISSGCSGNEITGDDKNLVGLTCTYTPKGTSATVVVTFITSKRAGILEYGNTPVSPRSLEMVIEVKDFPLSDNKNHVRMDVGLLTASGAGSVEGSANVVHREGHEDLYIAASTKAVVDGKSANVDVTIQSGDADLGSNEIKGILKIALGGNIDAQIAHVDFPAGATDFVYDPAVGSGKDVYEAGASTIALSALVALVCALLYLF